MCEVSDICVLCACVGIHIYFKDLIGVGGGGKCVIGIVGALKVLSCINLIDLFILMMVFILLFSENLYVAYFAYIYVYIHAYIHIYIHT